MRRQIDGAQVVRVFMMTPYPEPTQQTAFRDVVAEANDVKARAHGVQFKPLGSAESGLGRLKPKALRHKDLLAADVAVAVVGSRWDAAGARHFEALYDLARSHDKPLWLYARALTDAQLADPNDELDRVLAFRDRVEQDGQVRYARYEGEEAWAETLLHHLFDLLDNRQPDPPPGPASTDGLAARLAVFAEADPGTAHGVLGGLREAWTLAEAGRLTRAQQHFARLVAEQPTQAVQSEYARFLGHCGALEQAEALYTQAREGAPAAVASLIADGYSRLGHTHEQRADLDAARRLYRASLGLNERLDRPTALAENYGSLGNLYWMLSELEEAEQAFHKALTINKRRDRRDHMATDYSNLGNVYGVWGRLDEAEQMYRQALVLNEELGRQDHLANQYDNLGIIYRVQGRLDDAEVVYRQALALNEAVGHQEGMAEDYNNLGNIFQDREQYDEAEQMYRQALALNEAMDRPEGMANQYGNLGILHQARSCFDEAEQMYRRALAIYETLGDFVTIEQVRIWISDLDAHRRLH